MRGLHKLLTALIVGAFMAVPTGAVAQSAQGGYNQPGGVVQDQIETQRTPASSEEGNDDEAETPAAATAAAPPPSNDGGQLPFTGFDLALVLGAGGLLLLLGFGIRRFTRAVEAV